MSERAIIPTQSALLELQEERAGMREGYRFLDEKRLILAAEILAELGRYERAQTAFAIAYREAVAALRAAVARHGLEGLALYPPNPPLEPDWRLSSRRVLGIQLHDLVESDLGVGTAPASVATSPEGSACRDAFAQLIPSAAVLGALIGNLRRLHADYARTARRARALEDVLLPEIDETLGELASALEELDREEVIRAHRVRA
ncbi:MAG: ATPase [Sphingobacteriia bacterium]|nr:ATPase [Sphingobacteriia bacterium]NCC37912.1 ATPase [Gammaproteobacteria bacterium]